MDASDDDVYDVLRDREISIGPYIDAIADGDTIRVQVSSTFETDLRRRVTAEVGRQLADIRFVELSNDAKTRIIRAMMLGDMPVIADPKA